MERLAVGNEFLKKVLRITFSVTFYMIISISLVFLNKIIFKNPDFEFPFPILVTWFQLVVALGIAYGIALLGKFYHPFFSFIPLELKWEKIRLVAPLTGIYVGMLVFNNLCLKFVNVFFYQVARSLTIVFNIIFTYLILHTSTSYPVVGACVVVILGFLLGSKGEAEFSFLGTLFGVSSSVFVALYSIFVKKVLGKMDYNEWELLLYNTFIASIFLFPLTIILGELQGAVQVDFLFHPKFLFINVLAAVVGFLINIAIFTLIKWTSPLTNNIAGTVKACLQSALSVVVFSLEITTLALLGIILVIAGSTGYSMIRYVEMKKRQRAEDQAAQPPDIEEGGQLEVDDVPASLLEQSEPAMPLEDVDSDTYE